MYLKSLVLKGFKSFADRSVLSLEPGITAIVGPNGSGKSNILDAVLWVLGERNARNLRGQAMEDVIFAGSATRKPVGIAEVDLVLDNSDHVLPVDFDEVAVTRRMYRSGESEYLINGTVCRRMDVQDLLHDSGLGTGTHSIISQGNLDAVLQSKPEDRRALVEEAAGILKHKQRKEKSARKIARMEQNMLRVQDIAGEVERQLKPLERKAKKARTYRTLSDELTDLSLRLAVDDLRSLRLRWDSAIEREEELKSQLNKDQLAAYAADGKIRDLQHTLQEHQDASGRAAEGLHRIRSAADRVDSTVLLLNEKRRSVAQGREEACRRRSEDTRRLAEARRQHDEAAAAFEKVSAERDAAEALLEEARDTNEAASAALSDLQREMARLQSDERRLTAEGNALRSEQARTAESLSASKADEKLLAARASDLDERTEALETRLAELRAQEDAGREALSEAQARDAAARAEIDEAFKDAEACRATAEERRLEASKMRARAAALQEAEITRRSENRALSWVSDHRGDYGLENSLVDILDVPENLASLVDRLLGAASSAAFAADGPCARRTLRDLAKADEKGTVCLLARDASLAAPTRMPLPHGARYLVDLIGYPAEYAPAVELLLGDVVVCDGWDEAAAVEDALADDTSVRVPLRVVTPDGYQCDTRGLRRFVRTSPEAVGTVERHAQLAQVQAGATQAEESVIEAERLLVRAQEELRGYQQAGVEAAASLAQARGESESLHRRIAEAERDLGKLADESAELARRREGVAAALEQMKPVGERVESRLEQCEVQLEQVRAALQELRTDQNRIQQEATSASEFYTKRRLEAGRLAERSSSHKHTVTAGNREIARLEQELERSDAALKRRRAPEALDPIIASLSSVREAMTARIAVQEQGIDASKEESAGIHVRIDEARRMARDLHARMDESSAHLSDLRVEKGRLEVQVENAVASIEHDRGLPIDRAMNLPRVENRSKAEERVDTLRRRIANMGNVNPDAVFEYEQLKERYDYLKGQMEDLLATKRSLSKIVEIIDDRMRDDFVDTFHEVNDNFQEIFAELFPGGSAALSLVNEQDLEHSGIEVHAQPRGKRIAKLSLMSGGEKSLTALALLFAVYKTRATPFYILDEVEAALDDTNLRRLCAYWDKMRGETQLIMITHQRRTMEMADVLYGISMQQDGVTKLLSQRLDQAMRSEEAHRLGR